MKTLLSLIIVALIGAVGYLWTQLQDVKKELNKQEPKVIINIHKNEPKSVTAKQSFHESNDSSKELEETIKSDFKKIFKDIFGNPKVQKEIKDGVQEFKKGLNQALSELQKNVNKMDKESGNIFDNLLKELGAGELKVFEDKNSFYELIIDLHHDENAKVEIDVKGNLLSVKVTSHYEQKVENKVVKKESFKSYIVQIPRDCVIDMVKSEYKNGMLYITVPKKSKEKI